MSEPAGIAAATGTLQQRHAPEFVAAHLARELARYRASCTLALACALLLAAGPALSGNSFTLGRFAIATAYMTCAMGLGIAYGLAGELVLGHAAIMAASAYTTGMLNVHLGWTGLPAGLAGILAGTAFGFVIMLPGLRVRGWYLALVSLFCVLALAGVVVLAEAWTGGENGLSGVKRFDTAGIAWTDPAFHALSVLLLALTWLAVVRLAASAWGMRLKMCRDAPQAARVVGVDPARTRLVVYLLSALPPAIAGTLLAYIERFVNVGSYGISLTLLLLAAVVLGGAASPWGPPLGVAVLVGFSFWVGPFSPYNAIFLGLVLLVCSLAFPNGLAGVLRRRADAVLSCRLAPQASSAQGLQHEAATEAGSASGPASLVIGNVRKSFGGLKVLRGVSFDVPAGTFCGLIGPNGSGKSTLLNAVSGAIGAEGSLHVDGRDILGLPMHRRAALGIGRTFQTPQLVGDATVLENIAAGAPPPVSSLPGSLLRHPMRRRDERARLARALAIYESLGLPPELVCESAGALPLGLKRIVEIGRAMMARPRLLLLDEPAVGLNEHERRRLGELLRSLNQAGITILLVEHNVGFVTEYCSRLVLLEGGEVASQASLPGALPARLAEYLGHSPEHIAAGALA